ncbi:MAG TPA: hypothetical protein VFF48_12880 [Brevundimonas sp.]|nr:hypothetical protein [Brevundimonas sp.]
MAAALGAAGFAAGFGDFAGVFEGVFAGARVFVTGLAAFGAAFTAGLAAAFVAGLATALDFAAGFGLEAATAAFGFAVLGFDGALAMVSPTPRFVSLMPLAQHRRTGLDSQ